MAQKLSGRTVICINMGMTGPIARWKHSELQPQWNYAGSEIKTPTKPLDSFVVGESTETPIYWGNDTGYENSNQVKGFKVFFGRQDLQCPIDTRPGMASSKTNLQNWIQNYLRYFCQYIVNHIDRHLLGKAKWRANEVDWIFTVPGSWSECTVRVFHRLIEEVLHPLFPNSHGLRIHTNVKEAEASLMAINFDGIETNNPRYSAGKMILSCDIGGSTTNIAACQMSGEGFISIIFQFPESPSGVFSVQKEFWHHILKILKRSGVQNAEDVARGICCEESSETLNDRLMQDKDVFKFFVSTQLTDWAMSDETTTIEGQNILITRQTIASFFTPFVEEVENAISSALEKLELQEVKVDAVGICGGASFASYSIRAMSKRISTAGKLDISVISPRDLTFRTDLATIIGSSIIWDLKELREISQKTIFGIRKDDHIYWKLAEQIAIPTGSEYQIGWAVTFDVSTKSRSNTHHIVAMSKTSEAPPNTFEIASHSSGFQSWQIQTILSNSIIPCIQPKRKYQIFCRVVQDLRVVISCQDQGSGKVINFKFLETTDASGSKEL